MKSLPLAPHRGFFLLALFFVLFAQTDIHAAQSTANSKAEAISKATTEGKLILLKQTARWCVWCTRLKTVVFPSIDPNVRGELEERFVLWEDDVDVAPNEYFAYTQSNSLPTVAIIDPGLDPESAVKILQGVYVTPAGTVDTAAFYAWLRSVRLSEIEWLSSPRITGMVGEPFSYQSRATHSPTEWQSSNLPDFCLFDTTTGVLSGRFPAEPNTWIGTITARNATTTRQLNISLTSYKPGISFAGDHPWNWLENSQRPGSVGRTLVSGPVDNIKRRSDLVLSVQGPGEISFWVNVSTELHYDRFIVEIDGEVQLRRSGVLEQWEEHRFNLSDGDHQVTLRYEKDGSARAGRDNIWIDSLTYPETKPPADFSKAIFFSQLTIAPDRMFHLKWNSAAGSRYFIQEAPTPMGPWTDVLGSQVTAFGETETKVVPVNPNWNNGFFRVVRMSGL